MTSQSSQAPQTPPAPQSPHTFQVDLRGLVDLLSHHLYSSPKVYLRELLQNAVDAITARRAEQPGAPARVRLFAEGGALRVEDSGIGLTEADVHSLLATIGRSSKRDDGGIQEVRSDFLGQFGIGLLACFVVAERIRVVSRSARTPQAPPVEWTAADDGSYTVRTLPDEARVEPGTTVHLVARPGAAEWLAPARVLTLARDFGSLLPYDVRVGDEAVTDLPAPWDRAYPSPATRRVALARHCHDLFGFTPLDSIELNVPLAGIRGVAYVLPAAVSPAQRASHRVHLKGMLLTERAEQLLPDWAFFVRCVLDTDSLRPTASRESLYEDETLAAVREALGERIRSWLSGLAAGDPERLAAFLSVHHLGVKSLARHDREMLRTMLPWLPFETTDGRLSLEEFAQRHPVVHFTRTVEEYRQVAPIASAQGVGVVNGGYTYDSELVEALPSVRPGTVVAELDAETVTAHLDAVDPDVELALAGFLSAARARLDPLGCDVVLRAFHPLSVPALHLDDRSARHEQARAEAEERADDLWAGILGSLRGSAPRARLVLNHLNPLIRRISSLSDRELIGTATESLYGQALLMAQRPLRPADSALLNRAFIGLLEWATHPEGGRPHVRDVMDFDELRRAMAENYEQPEGPARNARAEVLLAEAERLNEPLAVIEALGHQLKVYNYSSEKDKMFVPFARLLRMWDERPEDFDEYEVHSLHWVFKWMSAGMLNQPHVPLASIEKWLGEMEHRYRLAGHSERAVRSAEFSVAAHVGDLARAERAYGAWLAADRDAMADCHACELHGQGWWRARRREDAEALRLWAPVLEGEYTCAHEPHTVLASSLVPLLRLGRHDEARAHHLRGFRLVRAMESMRGAYADHVEFCALTGNEARGLELLAERPAYFTDSGDPRSKLDFMSVVALLMGRLSARGFADQTVPGPAGRTWTARELAVHAREEALSLAARFDERNGTAYVSGRVRERMDRAPLLDRLPLGVRSARPVVPVPTPRQPAAEERTDTAAVPEDDLPALLAEARRLSESLHPGSVAAWAAVARAAEAEGVELEAFDRAEIVDHEAIGRGPEGRALFERAAELYEEAGDPGEAWAARARGANVHALTGHPDAALELISEPYEKILVLWADGGTGVRQTASVLVGRARILVQRMHETEDADAVPAAEAAVRALADFVEPRREEDVRLASRAAEARAMFGELAVRAGDTAAAADLFAEAAERYVTAGLPWFAVQYEARLAGVAQHLGDLETAERAALAALEHGGSDLEPVGHAQLHLQLAELLGAGERVEPAFAHALEAAHWADEAGEGPTLGAWARHLLGGFLLRLGRWAEAAEVLESALSDLTAETHGDGALAQTLWWLGDCHTELGEHREAAERWLRAADIARHWPEQRDHAMLAHLAAEALARAGLPAEADRAYARAVDLWGELGNVHGYVRALRARAWYAAREGREGAAGSAPEEARELMGDAVVGCEAALSDVSGEENRRRIVAELGETYRQFGDLLARSVAEDAELVSFGPVFEEALVFVERAVAVYGSLGGEFLDARTAAELAAGWLEVDLGRSEAAVERARGVSAAFGDREDETAGARRAEAERLIVAAEGTGAGTGAPG